MEEFDRLSLKTVCFILPLACLSLLFACAKVGPPPGGRIDKAGPEIMEVHPQDGDTGVPLNTKLTFTVNEWFDHNSFQDAFFISPEPRGKTKFKFSLHKIVVSFKDGLEEDKTYIITVGTAFRDLIRNPMEKSYTFAFSTGYRFDFGVIQGRVVGGKSGLVAALYPLVDDEIDFKEEKGEYMTQTGAEGGFVFSYLPRGDYRLLVFSDSDGDRLYDPDNEELGLSWMDFSVDEDTSQVILIKSKKRHPQPPIINSINPRDRVHLEIILDRPLETLPNPAQVIIIDTLKADSLLVHQLYRHPLDSARLILTTAPLDSFEYYIFIRGGSDFAGMIMEDSLIFTGNAQSDTLPPKIMEYTAEGDSILGSLEITCSEPVKLDKLLQGFSFSDSTRSAPEISVESPHPCKFELESEDFTAGDTVLFNLAMLEDLYLNHFPDSLMVIFINEIRAEEKKENVGSLSGTALFEGDYSIVIIAGAGGREIKSMKLNIPGDFRFEELPSGYYTFEAFVDTDGNGRYDYGLLTPFRYPERFIVLEDSFRVRSGWETGEVVIRFD